MLPSQCRSVVMELAHSIPLAGHLGRHCGIRDYRPYNPRRQKKIFLFAILKTFIDTIW